MSKTHDSIVLTVDLVCAYVSRNPVPASELPALLASIHMALTGLGQPSVAPAASEAATPAQIRKSVTQDALISFVDGRPYKTLKRHLTANGLDPAGYRARFGLPADYPMTAPSYAAQRSALAKAMRLGVPGAAAQQQAAE